MRAYGRVAAILLLAAFLSACGRQEVQQPVDAGEDHTFLQSEEITMENGTGRIEAWKQLLGCGTDEAEALMETLQELSLADIQPQSIIESERSAFVASAKDAAGQTYYIYLNRDYLVDAVKAGSLENGEYLYYVME